MFGKDFINTNPTPITTNIIRDDKTITYYYNSSKGDQFKFIFRGAKKETYLSIAQRAFETLIKDNYLLLPNNFLYLAPSDYWTIYKRWEYGKNFITITNNVKFYINDILYHFIDTNYYFSATKENLGGVYGIYYNNELLYIGSSVSDLQARWKEHDTNFRTRSSSNKMYQQDFNPDEIEYRSLIDLNDISNLINKQTPSSWLIEYTELIYIQIFKPLYNSEGITKTFSFKVKREDLPTDYWETFQRFLKNGDIQSQMEGYYH